MRTANGRYFLKKASRFTMWIKWKAFFKQILLKEYNTKNPIGEYIIL
jgi:hypothetical protein